MSSFSRAALGYLATPELAVRLMIAKATEDLGDILGRPLESVPERGSDDELLAALDFDVAQTREVAIPDPALERLLPQMSQETTDATTLRLDSERRIRSLKARQLRELHEILLSDDDRVLVPYGREAQILAALTDLRLLIAHRLEITDSSRLTQLRAETVVVGDMSIPRRRQTMVLLELYEYLTWWQDSLLQAMGASGSES